MKRTLLATAVGLTFIGASAQLSFAQPLLLQGTGGNPIQNGQSQEPPGNLDGGWQHWRREHHWRYSQNEPNQDTRPGVGPGAPPPAPHHPPPPPPANAAHFVFQRGHARIDITCPQAFALNDCIQAATELLDKINSLHAGKQHHGVAAPPGNVQIPRPNSGAGNGRQTAPGGAGGAPVVVPNPSGGNDQQTAPGGAPIVVPNPSGGNDRQTAPGGAGGAPIVVPNPGGNNPM